jgi:hypothetical protein
MSKDWHSIAYSGFSLVKGEIDQRVLHMFYGKDARLSLWQMLKMKSSFALSLRPAATSLIISRLFLNRFFSCSLSSG